MVFTHVHPNMEVSNVSRFPRTEPEIAAVLDWREGRCVIVHQHASGRRKTLQR